jgi:hypothetical protein
VDRHESATIRPGDRGGAPCEIPANRVVLRGSSVGSHPGGHPRPVERGAGPRRLGHEHRPRGLNPPETTATHGHAVAIARAKRPANWHLRDGRFRCRKIVVSPVRVRVSPLPKVLETAPFRRCGDRLKRAPMRHLRSPWPFRGLDAALPFGRTPPVTTKSVVATPLGRRRLPPFAARQGASGASFRSSRFAAFAEDSSRRPHASDIRNRASAYGTEGQRFESSRARYEKPGNRGLFRVARAAHRRSLSPIFVSDWIARAPGAHLMHAGPTPRFRRGSAP